MRQEERQNRIAVISSSIKKELAAGKQITLDLIILATSSEMGLSKRTAQEYVEIALFNLGLDKNLKSFSEKKA